MVFRTAGAVATVLIGVGRHALAQYYPPPSGLSAPAASPYGKCRRVAAGQSARGAAGSATVGREWDQLISPRLPPDINRKPRLILQSPAPRLRQCAAAG